MKVLYYLDSLDRGGAEMQALDVCRNAERYDIEITLVTGRGGTMESDFRETGVYFERFERKLPVDLYLASRLRALVKDRRIDIVHGYQPVDGIHLYLASRGLSGVRRVLSFQGFIQDRKNRMTARFLIPRMDVDLVVSRGLKRWLAENDGLDTSKHFEVLYNGADPDRLKPAGHSIRRELELPAHSLLGGMVGNFYRDRRKDQLTLCRALPLVMERFPNFHFIFAGGIERGAEDKFADCLNLCIKAGLTERVHFLGSRGDVPDLLSEIDLFVFSSLHEGLPVAVSEAMLSGVPLVVSDIDPLLEVTDNGRVARVFAAGDHKALAREMSLMLENEALRGELSALAKQHAEENYSIDAHLRSLRSIYDRLMNKVPQASDSIH